MYTSDIDADRKRILRHTAVFLCAALFLTVFGAVYEHFSFGVHSGFMVYAFVYPLIAALLTLNAAMGKHHPSPRTLFLLHACTAACAVGSIAAGIIKISGREHPLLIAYPLLGAALCMLTVISCCIDAKSKAAR